jgi:hypothetical protein
MDGDLASHITRSPACALSVVRKHYGRMASGLIIGKARRSIEYARDRGCGTCVMSVQQLAGYGLGQVARAFIIDQTLKIEILNSEAVKPQWHG